MNSIVNRKYKVGILGATGLVGQKFIELLLCNDKFEIIELGASEKSVGNLYKNIYKYNHDVCLPEYIQNMYIKSCIPNNFINCDLIFSALPSESACLIEQEFVKCEFPVISNSAFYRNYPDIPLVVPYINNDHLQLINKQRISYNLQKGFLVTNANCVTTGLMYAIYNLHKLFNIQQMNIVTMQAISGAGYSGINAYDICNNIIPYIDCEEEKIKTEPLKILGLLKDVNANIEFADIKIDATCNRVDVIDGHTCCVSLKFENFNKEISLDEVKQKILDNNNCIYIHDDKYRPQPRIDCALKKGYGISIGRIRTGNYWDLEMTFVLHNTVLGAAGSAILNAELCMEYGLI